MRTTFNNAMLAHVWANRSQEYARTANGNFYFRSDTIYSYGNHFPIARHVDGVVLFTTRDYSVTTSAQVTSLAGVFHKQVFFVTDPTTGHKEHLADYRQRIEGTIASYRKAQPQAGNR